MSFHVPSLEVINEQAKKNFFSIEEIPWALGVDRSLFWGPAHFTHLYYCKSYALLNEEEQRFYNQVHACGIAEQFVFLEELLLVRGLGRLVESMGPRLPPAMKEAIETFVVEEIKHGEMFSRLLRLAFPEIYEKNRFDVYRLKKWELAFLDNSLKYPETWLWWVWLAVLFEEKTLDFYRKYLEGENGKVDPLFHAVHKFHAKDEMRHFQLDHHFVDFFWAKAPRWKTWFNVQIFGKMMYQFTHPSRTVRHAINRVVERFPRLEAHRETILTDCLSVFHKRDWQQAFYSREVLPHTFALFDRFPELQGLTDAIPLYQPVRA